MLVALGGVVSLDEQEKPIRDDAAVAEQRGDADRDGDVDLADYLQLVQCFSGTSMPISADCHALDFDRNGHVDLADLVAFQAAFTGPR